MASIWDFDSQSGGSNPPASANMGSYTVDSSGWDCKSHAFGLGWCDSITPHHFAGVIQLVECRLAKADGAGSTPVSCSNACIAQQVEHILGKDEVMRSSRIASSIWAGNSEVEWRTENPFVGGSIPPWPTKGCCSLRNHKHTAIC